MPAYSIRNLTAGAAAAKTFLGLTAPANGRVKLKGIILGNTAATAAQGVEWELFRYTTEGTQTVQTPNPLDPDAPAARATGHSTYTAEPTGITPVVEFGFDIVGTYILWFPPGSEPIVANSGNIGLRKTVGADTTNWAITLIFEE